MSGEFRATTRVIKSLDNRKFLELRRRVNLNNKVVRVGLPANKEYREKDEQTGKYKKRAKGAKRIMLWVIGAVHEFGAPERGISARPWLRPGIKSGVHDFVRLNRRNLLRIINGKMTAEQALRQLGAMAVGKVQQYIKKSSNFLPLKDATIKRKGSSAPLIDTGQMWQSINYEMGEDKK